MRRGYSKNQVMDMEFPMRDYDFPQGTGEFTGTLVMKKWGDRNSLICYFDTDDDEQFKLCVWYKYDAARAYRPKNSEMDITRVEIGARMKVSYEPTKSGKTAWLDATLMQSGEEEK